MTQVSKETRELHVPTHKPSAMSCHEDECQLSKRSLHFPLRGWDCVSNEPSLCLLLTWRTQEGLCRATQISKGLERQAHNEVRGSLCWRGRILSPLYKAFILNGGQQIFKTALLSLYWHLINCICVCSVQFAVWPIYTYESMTAIKIMNLSITSRLLMAICKPLLPSHFPSLFLGNHWSFSCH